MSEREIRVFSELQIWMHKHLIHFAALFILTGMPLISFKYFGWIAWALGYFVYKLFPGYTAYSAGVVVANWLHRLTAFILIWLIAAYVIGEIFRARRWEAWPECWTLGCLKKGIKDLVDYYMYKRNPGFGKYNLGQKLWIWGVVAGLIYMYITGTILWFRLADKETLQLVLVLHDIGFYLAIIGLAVHVYLAVMLPEHRPMVTAMFRTGTLPESFVKHHHPKYYLKVRRELRRKEKEAK